MQPSRLGLTSPAGVQDERTTTSTIGDDRHGGERGSNARSGRTVANPFPNQQDQGPIGYQGRVAGSQDQASTEAPSSPQATNPSKQKRLSEMTEEEKWGMPGILAKIVEGSPDYDPLAMGMDITNLGLDLQSTE
jgi:CCR4-NOT transcription complex subunit 2